MRKLLTTGRPLIQPAKVTSVPGSFLRNEDVDEALSIRSLL
jgi:hypothetical protein